MLKMLKYMVCEIQHLFTFEISPSSKVLNAVNKAIDSMQLGFKQKQQLVITLCLLDSVQFILFF